ncbi:sulfite exporter TauE/SafE family protein [Natronoflexus pectinivorans]|uniref:Probable membrane transporter protein n=1 Tax=Natronoflexus pectinivorans TaxID=682526 RepID=A0A4R2GHX8_9BACT|nr:sulfite exporter TauE/SafE family protein [Natronoflexus pectinivorans]TCO07443.1 hypothetical protein EV194_10848 [Natronoflexus pectinivorans]
MFFYSSIEPVYYLLPIIGFIVGLLGTMIGGGGGFVFLPLLTLVVGAPTQTAVITSLAATLPICLVGAVAHFRKGNVNLRAGLLFSMVGVVGAFSGAAIAGYISGAQLKMAFGVYSVVIALNIFFDTLRKRRNELKGKATGVMVKSINVRGGFLGFFAGVITGTFGTSGTAPVLAGLFSMRMTLKMVIGTSLMVVLVNTFFAIGAHFLLGQIDLTLVFFLTSGSAIGAVLGPFFLNSSQSVDKSENKIRYIYAAVMVLLGILMILR